MNLELNQTEATRLMWILEEKEEEYNLLLVRQGRPFGTLEEITKWRTISNRITTIRNTKEKLIRGSLGEETYALIKSER